ncbi:hypothetical protein BH20ACT2_BH20ACT2_22510 [soil metagenome]
MAATALENDATVLHYDRDFDYIAEATGLSARWIIPAGSGHDVLSSSGRWTCRNPRPPTR